MLAGLGCTDCKFAMHGVGQSDVDDIDGGVVCDLVKVVVVVEVSLGDPVAVSKSAGFAKIP